MKVEGIVIIEKFQDRKNLKIELGSRYTNGVGVKKICKNILT